MSTKQTQHSPTPWEAYNDNNGRKLKHWRIRGACVRDEPAFATIDSGGKLQPEYEAGNAAFIVRACNSHEALLAACKEGMAALKHYLDSVEDGKDDNAESAYQFMFVAIAAAEGN